MIGDESHCIAERQTPHGLWWRYRHSNSEPHETLLAAIRIAVTVAADEARERGKTYVVASASQPSPGVFVFAFDHPDASNVGISIMYELTPDGHCIRRKVTRH
jgi:hypothetical protein